MSFIADEMGKILQEEQMMESFTRNAERELEKMFDMVQREEGQENAVHKKMVCFLEEILWILIDLGRWKHVIFYDLHFTWKKSFFVKYCSDDLSSEASSCMFLFKLATKPISSSLRITYGH